MTGSRRAFLASAAALPALRLPQPFDSALPGLAQDRPAASRHSSCDPWVEVHAGHLRANAAAVHALTRVPILAVIKNNAYGAGVVEAARALSPSPHIHGFAVVKLHEAITLRDAGIRKPVLLMGPLASGDLELAARRELTLMVYTPIGPELDRIAARIGRPIPVHVCVDTGLGRVGIPHRQAFDFISALASAKGVRIDGTMMTFTE